MNTMAKRGFRSPSEFVDAANAPQPLMNVDPKEGITVVTPDSPAAPVPAAPQEEAAAAPSAAPAVLQATNEVAPTEPAALAKPRPSRADKQPAIHTHKRATDEPPPPPPAPWDALSKTVKSGGFNLRPSLALHAQMEWVRDNVPRHKSMHEVAIKAVEAYVHAMIEKHYKPEDA